MCAEIIRWRILVVAIALASVIAIPSRRAAAQTASPSDRPALSVEEIGKLHDAGQYRAALQEAARTLRTRAYAGTLLHQLVVRGILVGGGGFARFRLFDRRGHSILSGGTLDDSARTATSGTLDDDRPAAPGQGRRSGGAQPPDDSLSAPSATLGQRTPSHPCALATGNNGSRAPDAPEGDWEPGPGARPQPVPEPAAGAGQRRPAQADRVLLRGHLGPRGSHIDLKTRRLLTIAALVSQGKERQMKGHFGGALNQGITPEELTEAVVKA